MYLEKLSVCRSENMWVSAPSWSGRQPGWGRCRLAPHPTNTNRLLLPLYRMTLLNQKPVSYVICINFKICIFSLFCKCARFFFFTSCKYLICTFYIL